MTEIPGSSGAPVSALSSDERTWAALAHLSILLALVTAGPAGPIAAFVIWLVKKDQSAYVGRQAMLSLVYQIVAVVLTWIMWVGIGITSMFVVGLCCIPFGLLASVGFVAYGCYAAYECYMGRSFNYWLIGDMIQ